MRLGWEESAIRLREWSRVRKTRGLFAAALAWRYWPGLTSSMFLESRDIGLPISRSCRLNFAPQHITLTYYSRCSREWRSPRYLLSLRLSTSPSTQSNMMDKRRPSEQQHAPPVPPPSLPSPPSPPSQPPSVASSPTRLGQRSTRPSLPRKWSCS